MGGGAALRCAALAPSPSHLSALAGQHHHWPPASCSSLETGAWSLGSTPLPWGKEPQGGRGGDCLQSRTVRRKSNPQFVLRSSTACKCCCKEERGPLLLASLTHPAALCRHRMPGRAQGGAGVHAGQRHARVPLCLPKLRAAALAGGARSAGAPACLVGCGSRWRAVAAHVPIWPNQTWHCQVATNPTASQRHAQWSATCVQGALRPGALARNDLLHAFYL